MGKVPEYTMKAVNRYREKNEYIQFAIEKGTKERMKACGLSNSDIKAWIFSELEKREK